MAVMRTLFISFSNFAAKVLKIVDIRNSLCLFFDKNEIVRFKKDTGYGRAIETKRIGLSEIVKGVWCEFLLIEWKKTQAGSDW